MLSHIIGMPSAITIGLVTTTVDLTSPVGGVMGQMLEDSKSPLETGQTLVSVAGPGAVDVQVMVYDHGASVIPGDGV